MLESLTQKQKIIFFIILFSMIIVIAYYIYSTLYFNDFDLTEDSNFISMDLIDTTNNINSNTNQLETNYIIVYICGAVKENKVITLKEGSRICDAIDAACGLTSDADLTHINLAYILEDGEKIYIPKIGEDMQTNTNSTYTSTFSSTSKNNKININKATQTELEMIPGIGPSTALKILEYREINGKFLKIEDIKNVSGIGDAKFEKIENYITVK